MTPAVVHVLLALAGGERHGYAILKDVQRHGGSQLRFGPGTIYGTLQRLMEAGWVEEATPPAADVDARRRYYRMTRDGREALEAEVDRLGALLDAARAHRIQPRGLARLTRWPPSLPCRSRLGCIARHSGCVPPSFAASTATRWPRDFDEALAELSSTGRTRRSGCCGAAMAVDRRPHHRGPVAAHRPARHRCHRRLHHPPAGRRGSPRSARRLTMRIRADASRRRTIVGVVLLAAVAVLVIGDDDRHQPVGDRPRRRRPPVVRDAAGARADEALRRPARARSRQLRAASRRDRRLPGPERIRQEHDRQPRRRAARAERRRHLAPRHPARPTIRSRYKRQHRLRPRRAVALRASHRRPSI